MTSSEPLPFIQRALGDQDRQWSRHAANYEQLFLDPFRPGVVNPLISALEATTDPGSKTVIDLGCGTGPLLQLLIKRFQRTFALDFAPGMIVRARQRLGAEADRVEFLIRPMHQLQDLAGQIDLAIAVNSIVMPDPTAIDLTLQAIRACLRPGGQFLAIVPAIDAIHYHTMLLLDRELAAGLSNLEAERQTAILAEHEFYDFAFGRFAFQGLRQKFWQPFEVEFRLRKAGFRAIRLEKVLYPWDEHLTGWEDFVDQPRSWDWFFAAEP